MKYGKGRPFGAAFIFINLIFYLHIQYYSDFFK